MISNLGHLHISDEIREIIACKLAQGIEPNNIMDQIRRTIHGVNRDSLVTTKDIQNIKMQYNISKTEKHKDDTQSVHIWVDECAQLEHNPIIFYKPQNSPKPQTVDNESVLDEKDFFAMHTNSFPAGNDDKTCFKNHFC